MICVRSGPSKGTNDVRGCAAKPKSKKEEKNVQSGGKVKPREKWLVASHF
jgi:hypothetical protein